MVNLWNVFIISRRPLQASSRYSSHVDPVLAIVHKFRGGALPRSNGSEKRRVYSTYRDSNHLQVPKESARESPCHSLVVHGEVLFANSLRGPSMLIRARWTGGRRFESPRTCNTGLLHDLLFISKIFQFSASRSHCVAQRRGLRSIET